jgi:hypothetical protein
LVIVGGNPSEILGSLYSNGKVFLINPNGIIFGAGSQIDTQGLLASTLNLSNSDFQKGNFHFIAGSNAGNISNEGIIHAGKDGNIVLIAPNIENNGIIKSEGGKIVLAAGQELILTSMDDPEIRFQVQAPKNSVLNVGQLLTEGGSINVFAGSIKHSGDISADSVEIDKQGNIRLVAKGDVTLEKDSTISANNDKGVAGKIEVTGENVAVLDNSKIEAVGEKGGGEILLGGDYQGKNPAVQNAKTTTIAENVEIKADAKNEGNGGKVIVWSDNETKVAATFSAKGGKKSGDGGLVETSAHKLDVKGVKVDTSAPKGKTGEWLLDPWNVTIVAGNPTDTDSIPNPYLPTSTSSISAQQISNALLANSVSISTTSGNHSQPGGDAGDIIVDAVVTWAANTLTLRAERNININANLNGSGTAQLALEYGQGSANGVIDGVTSEYKVNAPINLPARQKFKTQLGTDTINGGAVIYDVITTLGIEGSTSGSDLQGMNTEFRYALGANIDARVTSNWNNRNGFIPISGTGGEFDGLGHTITDLTINGSVATTASRLFAETAQIKNLTLNANRVEPPAPTTFTPMQIKITADGFSRFYGTVNPNFTGKLTEGSYLGSDTWDSLGVSFSTNANQKSEVGDYFITPKITNSNYALTPIDGILKITPASLTVTANALSKRYNTPDPALTYSAIGLLEGDALNGNLSRVSGENVGSYAITSTLENRNYAVSYIPANFDILPANVTVIANPLTKIYGAIDPVLTYSTQGLLNGDTLTGNLSRVSGENVGSYGITQGSLASPNYSLNFKGANFDILPAGVTVIANPLTKIYGAIDPILTYSTQGLLNGDTLTGNLSRVSGENVGFYGITQGSLASPNYSLNFKGANFDILPAGVTVIANPLTKIYGAIDPILTYSTQGLLNGDTLTGNLSRVSGENVGAYGITQGSLANPNYSLNFKGANFDILPAGVTVIANPLTKIYGAIDPVLTYSTQGLLNGDTLTGNLSRISGENVGAYGITQGSLANPNYSLNFKGANFDILPASLTITALAQSKIFGSLDPELKYTVDGLVGNDKLTGELKRVPGETVKIYEITSNLEAGKNYTLRYVPNFLTIERAPTIKWIGSIDNKWINSNNWDQGVLPDSTQNVEISKTLTRIDLEDEIAVNSLASFSSLHLANNAVVNVKSPFILQEQTVLSGTGKFSTPKFINKGTISPGNSPGLMQFDGNFIQEKNGSLRMEIQDETSAGYDKVKVSNDATLGGTLKLIALDGYKPSLNFQPEFISASHFVGNFDRIDNNDSPGLNYKFNVVNGQFVASLLPNSLAYQSTIRNLADSAEQANEVIAAVEENLVSQMNTVITLSPQPILTTLEELDKETELAYFIETNSKNASEKVVKPLGVCQ